MRGESHARHLVQQSLGRRARKDVPGEDDRDAFQVRPLVEDLRWASLETSGGRNQHVVLVIFNRLRPAVLENDVVLEEPRDRACHTRRQSEDTDPEFGSGQRRAHLLSPAKTEHGNEYRLRWRILDFANQVFSRFAVLKQPLLAERVRSLDGHADRRREFFLGREFDPARRVGKVGSEIDIAGKHEALFTVCDLPLARPGNMPCREGFDVNRRIKVELGAVLYRDELVHDLLEHDFIVDRVQPVNFLVQPHGIEQRQSAQNASLPGGVPGPVEAPFTIKLKQTTDMILVSVRDQQAVRKVELGVIATRSSHRGRTTVKQDAKPAGLAHNGSASDGPATRERQCEHVELGESAIRLDVWNAEIRAEPALLRRVPARLRVDLESSRRDLPLVAAVVFERIIPEDPHEA